MSITPRNALSHYGDIHEAKLLRRVTKLMRLKHFNADLLVIPVLIYGDAAPMNKGKGGLGGESACPFSIILGALPLDERNKQRNHHLTMYLAKLMDYGKTKAEQASRRRLVYHAVLDVLVRLIQIPPIKLTFSCGTTLSVVVTPLLVVGDYPAQRMALSLYTAACCLSPCSMCGIEQDKLPATEEWEHRDHRKSAMMIKACHQGSAEEKEEAKEYLHQWSMTPYFSGLSPLYRRENNVTTAEIASGDLETEKMGLALRFRVPQIEILHSYSLGLCQNTIRFFCTAVKDQSVRSPKYTSEEAFAIINSRIRFFRSQWVGSGERLSKFFDVRKKKRRARAHRHLVVILLYADCVSVLKPSFGRKLRLLLERICRIGCMLFQRVPWTKTAIKKLKSLTRPLGAEFVEVFEAYTSAQFPKLHELIHYARLIKEIGSPRNLGGERCEASHGEFVSQPYALTSKSGNVYRQMLVIVTRKKS